MLNQKTPEGFGNVGVLKTPKTDRFIAQHQNQEFADQLNLENQVMDLDKQLSSQLGNVLNVDIPELTQRWQEYKNAKKQLLFDKSIQKNPVEFSKKQIEANQKLGNAMQLINDSQRRKQLLAAQLADFSKNNYKYEDDFSNRYSNSLSTPTTLASKDPNFDNFVWNGPDMNFSKVVKDAAGLPRQLRESAVQKNEVTEYTPIIGLNDPVTYKSKLDGNNFDRKYQVTARKILQNMSPQEIDNINREYANLSKDKLQNWGLSEIPNLEPKDPNNPAEVYNSLLAKKHALEATFQQGKVRSVVDYDKKRELNMKDWMTKAGITQQMRMQLQNQRQQFQLVNKDNKKDDDASEWVSFGPEILKNGTAEQKQAYLYNLATGGGKAKFKTSSVYGIPSVTYTEQVKIPGTNLYTTQEVTKELDPNNPNLNVDLVNIYNQLKGRNVKIIRNWYNKDQNQTNTVNKPTETEPKKGLFDKVKGFFGGGSSKKQDNREQTNTKKGILD